MKFTGKVVKVSKQGKINIPMSVLKKISFRPNKDQLTFSQEGESLIIRKKIMVCCVTGKVSDDITELFPGMFISREGMILLLQELKKQNI